MAEHEPSKCDQELRDLRLQYRYLLETMKSGVVTLDGHDVIVNANDAAVAIWGVTGSHTVGKPIQNTELVKRCPELTGRLQESRATGPQTVSFNCHVPAGDKERFVSVTIRPMVAERAGERVGTLIYCEDMSVQQTLQSTIEQLEATGEELQSANEELETMNEELQSTNQELETTNEELQSTNEELETTNEELQSLNDELETMNDELEAHTRQLDILSSRYAETLNRMPWPVILVDGEEKVQVWNTAAQRLFGVGAGAAVGVSVERLPIEASLRKAFLLRCRAVLSTGKAQKFRTGKLANNSTMFDVEFAPLRCGEGCTDGVLVIFGHSQPAERGEPGTRSGKGSAAANRKTGAGNSENGWRGPGNR